MNQIYIKDMEFSYAYVQMFDLLDDCILVVDAKGTLVLFNKASEALDDVKREDVLGKSLDEVYASERYHSATMACLRTKKAVINMVQHYTTIYGKSVLTISSSYPLIKDEEMQGVMTITKDISRFYKIMDVFHHHEPKAVKEILEKPQYTFADLIGESDVFLQTVENARAVAETGANVLIYGETGTGKELFAQSIHNASGVPGEFVPINCAAIPENLLESLLFGTSKGAYTGAVDSAGLFEEAENGTLFLDEIHAMSEDLQAKLLRAVETRKIRRVGETKEEKINFRLLTAINVHPKEAVQKGLLRMDLYYRLGVVTVTIPPLRQRPEDIPLLVDYFLRKVNEKHQCHAGGFTSDALAMFTEYHWPGNVRELEHAVEHSCIVAEHNKPMGPKHLPAFVKEKLRGVHPENQEPVAVPGMIKEGPLQLDDHLNEIEKQIIQDRLQKNKGNVAQTAKELGLSRQTLDYRMKRLYIE